MQEMIECKTIPLLADQNQLVRLPVVANGLEQSGSVQISCGMPVISLVSPGHDWKL